MLDLALELLEHLAARVAARGDCKNFQQRPDRRARRPRVLALFVEQRLLVEEVQAQEGPHPLVERLLVDRAGRSSARGFAVTRSHCANCEAPARR